MPGDRRAQGTGGPGIAKTGTPMTAQKHFKQLVRARMQKTGERYSTARRQVLAAAVRPAALPPSTSRPALPAGAAGHLPGNIPATTALRILLTHAGISDLSEALTFVLAGGIGAGVFAFLYEKEDIASLYLAGRHRWHDDLGYLTGAAKRLQVGTVIKEASGARPAEKHLREAMEQGRPVIAWVDAAHLPHRAMPALFSGGGYHVVTVYQIEGTTALIGDLADAPIEISLPDLATARGRIKKQKHRLLWLDGPPRPDGLGPAVRAGLGFGAAELSTCRMKNFRLDAFAELALRMEGKKGRENWAVMFPPGARLWTALTSLYDYIEHHGTGGGLCRPLFADGLAQCAARFGLPALRPVAARYADIGRQWSALADAALADGVAAFADARDLLASKAELVHSGGSPAEIRACWRDLEALAAQARKRFPLPESAVANLRHRLREQLLAIHAAEVEALDALRKVPAAG